MDDGITTRTRFQQPGVRTASRARGRGSQLSGYRDRQKVLPGITGWPQVNLGYDTSLDDVRKKVQADLEYIEGQSLLSDLKIMLLTAPVVIFRKGGW